MIIELPDSKMKIRVWVTYSSTTRRKGVYRDTSITIYSMVEGDSDHLLAIGVSSCSPLDQFCKLTGRRIACENLFKVWSFLSKNDRRVIFEKVCGKPTPKKRTKKQEIANI